MSDIFISYASEDRGRAKQLAEVLTQQDWSVWWDRKIPPGKTWAEVIEQQLDAARCVIVLWSRDSVASQWVKAEAREGKARGILIPILIEEAKIPLEFRHIQHANLTGWDPDAPRPDLNELLLELEQLLGRPKQRQQSLVPPVAAAPREGVPVETASSATVPVQEATLDTAENRPLYKPEAVAPLVENTVGPKQSTADLPKNVAKGGADKVAGEHVLNEMDVGDKERYAQAQQRAERQRQRAREAVEALRQRLHALEKQAAPLRSWVPDAWARAERCGQEAEVAWQEQRYPDATRLFELALRAYAEAHSAAQDAQTQQQAHEAQAQAEQAEQDARSIEGSVQGLAEAHKAIAAGEQAKSAQRWGAAVTAFTAAKEQYARIVYCYAKEARKSMEKALASAEHQGVSAAPDALWQRARALVSEAEDLWIRQAFLKAGQTYSEAERLLDDITSEIERERAKREAAAKQSQVAIIRERASQAEVEKYASAAFGEAVHTERRGDTALSQGEYAQARELYLTAQQRYAQAQQQAQVEQQRREALSVQEQAQQAEQRAIAVGASADLELYRQGQAAREQGDAILARGAFAEAAAAHARACRLYERAAETQRQRVRAAAEAARERALIAQAEAQGGAAAEIFADRWAQAQTLLHEADTALSQDHDDTARAAFEKCAALFRQLYDQALVRIEQQQAEQARTYAFGLQRELGDAKGWRLARAKRALARGQRLFERTNFSEARSSYEKAAALFTAWQQSAGRSTARQAPPGIGRPWTKLYPALALGAIAIGVTVYFTRPVQVPEPAVSPPPQAEQPAPPPKPLTVTPSPEARAPLTLAEGASQTFALKLKEPVSQPLRYTWFIDGIKQAQTQDWTYTPDFDAAAERFKEVKVVIVDPRDRKAEVRWQIQVVNTNRPPRVATATPAVRTLALASGQTAQFAVQGSDPDRDDELTYLWSLDGKKMGQGERWELTAETPGAHHRLEVALMDRAGLSDHRRWDIAVNAPPPLPPPEILGVLPEAAKDKVVVLNEGRSQIFSVKATSADPRSLQYRWYLNGRNQATGSQWTYKAAPSRGVSKSQTIRVVVSDAEGRQREHVWRVRVNPINRPPTIVQFSPGDARLEMVSGSTRKFTVQASDADTADLLSYSWTLDGRRVSGEKAWAPGGTLTTGRHRVGVKVADKSGASATQQWTITVSSKPEPPAPEILALKPIGLAEPEVRAWLDRYKRAWDTKNIDALLGLGEVSQSNAPKLRETLQPHREFQIRLRNVRIQIDGNEATVSFQREDVIDGRPHPHPDPKVVVLSKRADGTIGRSR